MRRGAGGKFVTSFLRGLLVLLASPLGCLCFFCRNSGWGLKCRKLLKVAEESSFDATKIKASACWSFLDRVCACSCLHLSILFLAHGWKLMVIKRTSRGQWEHSTTKMWWCKAEPLNQRVKSLSAAWARHSTLYKFATNRFRCENHKILEDTVWHCLILFWFVSSSYYQWVGPRPLDDSRG